MNEQLVLIAIGLVVAVIILRPLLRGRSRDSGRPAGQGTVPTAKSDELAELELDRAMGRVSQEDYARWREELEPGVPLTIADAREPQPGDAGDPQLGDAQERQRRDGQSEAEALVRQWRERPRPRCPNCGERPEPEARYCSNCGTALATDA